MNIVEGLGKKPYSISFKHGDYYLTTTDNCCFTYFSKRPNDELEKRVFDNMWGWNYVRNINEIVIFYR